MVQIFIEAGILCGLLYLVAKYEADYSFSKVVMVTAGTSLGLLVIEGLLVEHAWWLKFAAGFGFIAFMLMTFCWISLKKSMLVVLLYFVVHVGISLGVAFITSKIAGSVGAVMSAPATRSEKAFNDVVEGMYGPGAFGDAPPETAQVVPSEAKPAPVKKHVKKTKKRKAPGKPADSWTSARQQLKMGGRMKGKGGVYSAIINGEIYEKGDTIQIKYMGNSYKWRVGDINQSNVNLEPIKQ